MNCLTTMDYLKEKRRMIVDYEKDCGKPLLNFENGFEMNFPRLAIEIVQKWSNEHPAKTLFDDLKEKYPNYLWYNKVPTICPYNLGYEKGMKCEEFKSDCGKCWNRPLDEVIKK